MNKILSYTNDHHFNEGKTLFHEFDTNGKLISRKWVLKRNEILYEPCMIFRLNFGEDDITPAGCGSEKYDGQKEEIVVEVNKTHTVDFTKNNTLKDLEEDILDSFFFTGVMESDSDFDLIKHIYNTKLPPLQLRQYDMYLVNVEDVDIFKASELTGLIPQTYGELFKIIGDDGMWHLKEPYKVKKEDKEYIIYQVFDSMVTSIKIEENILYFGYYR